MIKKLAILMVASISLFLVGACATDPMYTSSTGGTVEIQGRTESHGTLITPEVDNTTTAMTMIDHEHSELHDGWEFSAYSVVDMAGSGNNTMMLYTPPLSSGIVHMVTEVLTESEVEYEIYEGSTVSANGTPIVAYNRNRTSANTAQMLVWLDPAGKSLGTRIAWRHWGSGKGVGGEERGTHEWMLKPQTVYLVRITNATVNPNQASIKLTWYRQE